MTVPLHALAHEDRNGQLRVVAEKLVEKCVSVFGRKQ
jgi:hypothetical protein